MGISCFRPQITESARHDQPCQNKEHGVHIISEDAYNMLAVQSISIHHAVEIVKTIEVKLIEMEKKIDLQIKMSSPAVSSRKLRTVLKDKKTTPIDIIAVVPE